MIDPAFPQRRPSDLPLRTLGTAAWQLAPALALVAAGQVTVGGVLSVTVKLVVQVPMLPAASVAVTVIVCAPRPSSEARRVGRGGGIGWALEPLQAKVTRDTTAGTD